MDLDKHIFDFAYYLLDSSVGQKHLKYIIQEFIQGRLKLRKAPSRFQEMLLSRGISIVPFWSDFYPFLLKETLDYPPLLFLRGDSTLLKKICVTMVGTRKMDDYGARVLGDFFQVHSKLRKGICFVSGLAYGVDSEVHRLCLKKNLPTIGVVAGGMDKRYYRGNTVMYEYLSKYRLVISEFPPGRKYFKGMFPLRNRILAALSVKTFVIQAGNISGALNTASHANNYGRDVYVVPHDIYSEVGQGCSKLFSDGANIVLDIDDFVDKSQK